MARREGWELIETIDNGTRKPRLRIFGVSSVTNQKAAALVYKRAKEQSELHLAALRAIVKSQA
jgi:hypothetical protein